MSTLLEAATNAPKGKRKAVSDEELELAIAFMAGSLTFTQVAHALGMTSTGAVSSRMVQILRHGIINGRLQIHAVIP